MKTAPNLEIAMAALRVAAPFAGGASHRLQFAAAVLAVAVLVAAAPARAQQPPSPGADIGIVVTGEGKVRVAPDYAEITSGVTTRAKTVKEATDANSKLMAAITSSLVKSGIEQKEIQTSRFSLQPIYTREQPGIEAKLSGYAVTDHVTVTIRQIDRVAEILDRLVAAGATDVGDIAFLHSDRSRLLDQARQSAFADARRKAELYAQASGVRLGRVLWITEAPAYARAAPLAAARAVAAAAVPISPGEDTLSLDIIVGFESAH